MANALTCIRILCSIVLLFCPTLSKSFFVIYVFAGLTDMMDGFVARKSGTCSEFGAKLDTIADTTMIIVCLIKFLPVLNMETWMYIWIVMIAMIKGMNLVLGYILKKKLVTIHSVSNKITGFLLFVLPVFFETIELKYSVILVCTVATFAAIQEGYYIRVEGDD